MGCLLLNAQPSTIHSVTYSNDFRSIYDFLFQIPNLTISDDLQEDWFNFTKEFKKAAQIDTSNILPVKYKDWKLVVRTTNVTYFQSK